MLNVTVGWTVVGWAIALIWAAAWGEPILTPTPERRPCPHCAELILPAAKVCRFCGSGLRAGWANGAEVIDMPRRAG